MRRMSMSKLQSLPKSWRQRHHEQPLGIPGHKRPSLPHRRWNCRAGRCLSRKCSSSKLRLVPGRRESDMEVDQIWHLRDLMKYKWDTTPSFQIPLDSGQMSLTQRCTSSQYHANIPVESIPGIPHHTTQHEFKSKVNSFTSLHWQSTKIGNWKCDGWAWADYKTFHQTGDKDTMSSHLESRDTKGLHSLSADGIGIQVDACHGSVRLQSFSQCLAKGKATWK